METAGSLNARAQNFRRLFCSSRFLLEFVGTCWRSLFLAGLLGMFMIAAAPAAEVTRCGNHVKRPYNTAPSFFAPEGSRGEGIQIWLDDGQRSNILDTRAACLPIALRYNNPGVLKTPRAAPWPEQIAKDDKGHAIFPTVQSGIAAWGLWIKKRAASGEPQTAMTIMSVYAPPDDCVGSVGRPPNCPYGVNPTAEYAKRVASSINKGPNDPLPIGAGDCRDGREVLYAIFQQIATFEIGGEFCGRPAPGARPVCSIDRELFDRAMDAAFSPVREQCS